jgi:acetate---CoA ligase (ADP-forming)
VHPSSSVVEAAVAPHAAVGALLEPRAVAVIGASSDPTKRGHHAVRALLDDGYTGAIHPVHPRGGTLFDLRVARSVAELPPGIDLALICTPADTVAELVEACGAVGIRGAVVLALGFGEIGGEGALHEQRLRAAIRRSGVRVVGPNTSGIANPSIGLNLIGVRGLRPGGLALLAQSGNVLLGALLEARRRPALGFSCCIGAGNAIDITLAEYLAWLATDERTHAIALYAEGIGDGRAFLDAAARAVANGKPVVLLKGGRTHAGDAAAQSHTGALSGGYAVLRAALREAGVVEVERSDEFFPLVETLLLQPSPPRGSGLAILADGGGHATLAADHLTTLGVRLATTTAACRRALSERLGATAAVANPVDIAGAADRDPSAFAAAAAALLAVDDVGALLLVGLFGGYATRFAAALEAAEVAAAERLVALARAAGRPLVVQSLYADAQSAALDVLRAGGVPVCASLEAACHCVGEALQRTTRRERARARLDVARAASHVAASGHGTVRVAPGALEPELRELVRGHGVRVAPATFCRTAAETARAAAAYTVPLAVRAVAAGVSHKTEAGGVRLGIAPADAARVFDEVRASIAAHAVTARFEGVLVGPLLARPIAELLVGVRTDPVFGRVLAIGAGGTAVEVLRDVVLRVPPLDRGDIVRMLDELRIAPLLRGWRGAPPIDAHAVADSALALLACADAHADITELELNPVFAYADGAVAVDVRAVVSSAAGESR